MIRLLRINFDQSDLTFLTSKVKPAPLQKPLDTFTNHTNHTQPTDPYIL